MWTLNLRIHNFSSENLYQSMYYFFLGFLIQEFIQIQMYVGASQYIFYAS